MNIAATAEGPILERTKYHVLAAGLGAGEIATA